MQTVRHNINKLILLILLASILLAPTIAADYYYEANEKVDLRVPCLNGDLLCSSSAYCNITIYPYENISALADNVAMSRNGLAYFNYTLSPATTKDYGIYQAYYFCGDGADTAHAFFTFELNLNGKIPPQGNLVIFFFLAVIGVVSSIVWLIIQNIQKSRFDMDLKTFSYNLLAYFGLIIFYSFNLLYFGNLMINNLLLTFLFIGPITNVLVPGYLLWSSFLKRTIEMKQGRLQ